jgi:hypothetical protein
MSVKPKRPAKSKATSLDLIPGLPKQLAPRPAKYAGNHLPTDHEMSILRRVAMPRCFILVTLRADAEPLYTFENGEPSATRTSDR